VNLIDQDMEKELTIAVILLAAMLVLVAESADRLVVNKRQNSPNTLSGI